MDKIYLKILSVTIVLTVCSIDTTASMGEMSNVVRTIVISSNKADVSSTNDAIRLLQILDSEAKIPSDIKSLLSIADHISIESCRVKGKSVQKNKIHQLIDATDNFRRTIQKTQVEWGDITFYLSDLLLVSIQPVRAGPCY